MPPLNGRHVLSYEISKLKNWSGLKAELEHSYTGKQWHWDSTLDFVEPPGSYNLFNFHIGGTFDAIKSKPKFRIGVVNILNTSYRDYLNRQRYFADALGRNFTVSWIQHF
jgi:iron complex outermembrane receptor protein